MSSRMKRETIRKYLLEIRRMDIALPITRNEMHQLRWQIARDKSKNISFMEYVGLCEYIESMHKKELVF